MAFSPKLLQQGASGASAGPKNYIEDVFSTYLYTGTGAEQTIFNDINIGSGYSSGGGSFNTSSSILLPNNNAFAFSTSAFTVEFWFYPIKSPAQWETLFATGGDNGIFFACRSGYLDWTNNVDTANLIRSNWPTLYKWNHIVLCQNASNTRSVFINGTRTGTNTAYAWAQDTASFMAGVSGAGAPSGYMSNARIVKGSTVYDPTASTITVPTTSLTAVTNTVFLALQGSSPFTDTSSNAFSITQVGAPTATSFGPFTGSTAGKGGMVWFKARSAANDHGLYDTARGTAKVLATNGTGAEYNQSTTGLTSFNGNGFTVVDVANGQNGVNGSPGGTYSGSTGGYCTWTFREQAKFFDVVTYTGTGSAMTVSHNLGSVPGFMIIKRYSATIGTNWAVYHRSLGSFTLQLNNTNEKQPDYNAYFNNTAPTSSVFSIGTDADVNGNGATFVAYLFAHDAGGFGLTGTDNVISCGSVTANGSGEATINLGYEPQWFLLKNITNADSWYIFDNMRGMYAPTQLSPTLRAQIQNAEVNSGNSPRPSATGVSWTAGDTVLTASNTYIYVAIRRGSMKVPTSGTSVFTPAFVDGTTHTATFTPDSSWLFYAPGYDDGTNAYPETFTRLTGKGGLQPPNTRATNSTRTGTWDSMTSFGGVYANGSWLFKRAPKFHDVVCYTGTAPTAQNLTHNLQAVPELIIIKRRDAVGSWLTGSMFTSTTVTRALLNVNNDQDLNSLYSGQSIFNGQPTSSVFSVGTGSSANAVGGTYVAYLFATCAGVSKVGSYTGTATTKQIDCGFTAGARFVLIKRVDSTGDWYIWDTARGIIAGNDPYFLLNSTAAEVTNTDYIDTYSPGFELSSTAPSALNANGGTYIFLAIA